MFSFIFFQRKYDRVEKPWVTLAEEAYSTEYTAAWGKEKLLRKAKWPEEDKRAEEEAKKNNQPKPVPLIPIKRFAEDEKVFKANFYHPETKDPRVEKIAQEFKNGTRKKPAFYADLMETVTDAR